MTKDEYAKSMKGKGWPTERAEIADKLARHIDGATYDVMLEALLAAGAKPDAPWNNGITMLMWGGVETAKRLLKHGASCYARDAQGWPVWQRVESPEEARPLAAYGADITARATPKDHSLTYTPLQSALLRTKLSNLDFVMTFIDLGAKLKAMDGLGRTALGYSSSIEAFKLMQSYGLDANELLPEGRTFLHNLAVITSAPRTAFPDEVAFFKFLLSLGIDINAKDDEGQSLLHLAAARESFDEFAPNFELLIVKGADQLIKDKSGKRAFDLATKSHSLLPPTHIVSRLRIADDAICGGLENDAQH